MKMILLMNVLKKWQKVRKLITQGNNGTQGYNTRGKTGDGSATQGDGSATQGDGSIVLRQNSITLILIHLNVLFKKQNGRRNPSVLLYIVKII